MNKQTIIQQESQRKGPHSSEGGRALVAGNTVAKGSTRKKFFMGLLTLAGLVGAATFFKWRKNPSPVRTVKFLTQDGRLVELDASKLPVTKKFATKEDVQHWIKK
jgi:hypothetical protein